MLLLTALTDMGGVDSFNGERRDPPTDPRSESTLSPHAESRSGGLCVHKGGRRLALATGKTAWSGAVAVVSTIDLLCLNCDD